MIFLFVIVVFTGHLPVTHLLIYHNAFVFYLDENSK